MAEIREIGEVVEIPGEEWPAGRWRRIAGRYDYANDPRRCPSCRGLGIIFHGSFRCLNCGSMALVDTGEAFVPVAG